MDCHKPKSRLSANDPIADAVKKVIHSGMKTYSFLALLFGSIYTSTLPIDDMANMYEELFPEIGQYQEEAENELSRLGPPALDWTENGLTVAESIIHGGGKASTHVLGEWEVGGHSANVSGDMPFDSPKGFVRYSVRAHHGPVNYHSYYRMPNVPEGIIIHFFGSKQPNADARCHDQGGMEIIASTPWEEWSDDTMLIAFVGFRASRDDNRVYCSVYEPIAEGRYHERSYDPNGRPYLTVNENLRSFTVTSREEASKKLFDLPQMSAE
ncbi:MAG: hypothetical protein ABJP34_10550 [Erythrobacter sp.]